MEETKEIITSLRQYLANCNKEAEKSLKDPRILEWNKVDLDYFATTLTALGITDDIKRARATCPQEAKKVLKAAKGYRGGKSKLYKTAREAQMRALAFAYRDRKQRKRQFRRLWIIRLNAAVREYGLKYSEFINKLNKSNILINRKVLSNLVLFNKNAFEKVIETIKSNA